MVAVWNGWYRWPCAVHRNHSAVNMSAVTSRARAPSSCATRTWYIMPPSSGEAIGPRFSCSTGSTAHSMPFARNSVATWLAECASGKDAMSAVRSITATLPDRDGAAGWSGEEVFEVQAARGSERRLCDSRGQHRDGEPADSQRRLDPSPTAGHIVLAEPCR